MLLRAKGSTLEAWRHDGSAWSRFGLVQDATYAGAGFSGVGIRGTTGRLDDFGARSLSQNPPGAPTGLNALAGAGSVALSWNAPAFDGGSPISNYRVYRGTSPGAVSFHANAGTTTSYADTSVSNGTTYYYKVSAENGNGEGPLSNEANATPTDLVAPAAPLVALDTFNRANESPLSDAGKWSNNMNGAVENGLNVNANQLACSATTTCTAWRNNAQYGPDAESWARVSTLPGTGNAIRLYVRVQSPGTSAYDGYMLLVSQQAATDQATIYRITNSGLTALVTAPQELAVGDTVLLRAKGSTLEAWRHDGSAWSRFGLVQDATYAGAGFSGVGIRGTTGRLDDFGARTWATHRPTPRIRAARDADRESLLEQPDRADLGPGDGQRRRDPYRSSAARARAAPTLRRSRSARLAAHGRLPRRVDLVLVPRSGRTRAATSVTTRTRRARPLPRRPTPSRRRRPRA